MELMDNQYLLSLAGDLADRSPKNYVQAESNPDEAHLGMRIFERPIMSVAPADDEAFKALLTPGVVGPHFLLPEQWLPGAKSVISFFLPMTKMVRESNRIDAEIPSLEWLYGRVEGQMFINDFSAAIRDEIIQAGHQAVSPSIDEHFRLNVVTPDIDIPFYNSNWSERHVAYVCGLGTFGLHTNLITERGTAGRLFSIVTDLALEPTPRKYTGAYDYCTKCGACIRRCPTRALRKDGKTIAACSGYIRAASVFQKPRYGCGKCQTAIPCETRNPTEKSRKPANA
jgi:epoxyqueuosine reductase QueG